MEMAGNRIGYGAQRSCKHSGIVPDMRLLYSYLRNYWGLVAFALLLATINQVFSLLDPLIFRYVIDNYATRFSEYTTSEFFRGVTRLLAAAVGVAFVSRVAKNFQDYYINVITQRLGAQLYSDGIRHSLELPYSVFEDQRSGETLGKLQKVRSDVQKVIAAETAALAGATTESLRNIELVKSLGLGQQEIAHLNTTTQKILKLELKKVRYLR